MEEENKFQDKDQALSALEGVLKDKPDPKNAEAEKAYDELSSRIDKEARKLGADGYEIDRIYFLTYPPEGRQGMFNTWCEFAKEEPLDKLKASVDSLLKIKEEFGLEDPVTLRSPEAKKASVA